jgi:hypothetical protein
MAGGPRADWRPVTQLTAVRSGQAAGNQEWQFLRDSAHLELQFFYDSAHLELQFFFDSAHLELQFFFDSAHLELQFFYDSAHLELQFVDGCSLLPFHAAASPHPILVPGIRSAVFFKHNFVVVINVKKGEKLMICPGIIQICQKIINNQKSL